MSLSLNDGDKWEVPAQMKIFIDSSFVLISNLDDDRGVSEGMTQKLIRQKNGFIGNCNMQGKGHDILHEWLMPYIDILQMASESSSKDEKKQIQAELVEAKIIFQKYFK